MTRNVPGLLALVLVALAMSPVRAQDGALLLDDPFDAPGDWPAANDADFVAGVEAGVYRLEARTGPDAPRWVSRPGLVDPARAQYAEVDVRVTEGEGGGIFGLTWGGDAGRYVFYFSGGQVAYERYHAVHLDGVDLLPAPAWQTAGWNRVGLLRLPADGRADRIYVWVNGQATLALLTAQLDEYTGAPGSSDFGFLVAGDVTAEVDAVLVREMGPAEEPPVPPVPVLFGEQGGTRWVAPLPPSGEAPGGANAFLWLQHYGGSLGASAATIAADEAGAEWQAGFASGWWSALHVSQTEVLVCVTFRPEQGGRSCYLYRPAQTPGEPDTEACEGYAGSFFDTTFTPGINCRRYRSSGGEALWHGGRPFWHRAEVVPGR